MVPIPALSRPTPYNSHVNTGPDTMTTFDNNLYYTAPEIFKPGFEFLQKTQQDVDKLCAAMPEKIQRERAALLNYGIAYLDTSAYGSEPDIVYAIKVYLDMQKWAGKPCICATTLEAHECIKAALILLNDYKRTVDALEDKDETSKATIAARDEELAVCKEQLKAKDNQLKLAVCEEKLKAKEDLLKAKDENLKLSMELVALKEELAKAKQASKGKPLACVN